MSNLSFVLNEKQHEPIEAKNHTSERGAGDHDIHDEKIIIDSHVHDTSSLPPVLTKDGTKLHPQPTSDPLDPLNWSNIKKHGILAIVMALYFMFTAITTITVPSFPQLQTQYNVTASQINWTVAIPALGLSIGPLIWSSLADKYGRRIIFIIGTNIAFAATIGAAKAPTYGGYMAARFFQGLGVSPAATVGLAIINDLFFEYQRGQKIGLWVLAIDMGLLVGPLLGGFLDLIDQFWIQWFIAILFAAIFVAEMLFLPETLYPRNYMLLRMPYTTEKPREIDISETQRRESVATDVSLQRTTKLPFLNVKAVPGLVHPRPCDSLLRFAWTWKFAAVSIVVCTYCFTFYWWVLSIITMIPSAYAQYSPQIQGLFFIGLMLGTLFSEAFCSGSLSDRLVSRLARKNGGIRVPEMRLWLAYPAALLSALGLIIWGVSVSMEYHWIVGQVAFFLFAAGLQMGNTTVCSYIVDAYPLQSMSIVVFYSVLLNLSAFINPFFVAPWVEKSGYTWTFAAQGIITFFAGSMGLAFVHWKGGRLRAICGTPSWVNPEYDSVV